MSAYNKIKEPRLTRMGAGLNKRQNIRRYYKKGFHRDSLSVP